MSNDAKTLRFLNSIGIHAIGCRDDIMVDLMRYNIAPQDAFNIMETVRKKDKHLNSDQIKLMIDHKVPDYYIEACKKIEYMQLSQTTLYQD